LYDHALTSISSREELFGQLGQKLARGEEISNGHDRDAEQPGCPATPAVKTLAG
jgi:hypothetical protein